MPKLSVNRFAPVGSTQSADDERNAFAACPIQPMTTRHSIRAAAAAARPLCNRRLIVATHSGTVTHLHIVQRGLVGSRSNNAQAEPDRTLGPASCFRWALCRHAAPTTKIFTAIRTSHLYQLARADFLEFLAKACRFERYCTQAITEDAEADRLESLRREYSQRVAEQQPLARSLRARPEIDRHLFCDGQPARSRARNGGMRTCARSSCSTLAEYPRRNVHARRPAGACRAARALARCGGRRDDVPPPILPAGVCDRGDEAMHVMAEARHPAGCGRRERPGLRRGRTSADLFALQRVSMQTVNEVLRSAESVDALARRGRSPPADAGICWRRAWRRARDAHDCGTSMTRFRVARSSWYSHGADLSDIDWCWLALGARAGASRPAPRTRNNALLFTAGESRQATERRERLIGFAREVDDLPRHVGFPLRHRDRDGRHPNIALDRGMEAEVPGWIRRLPRRHCSGRTSCFDFRPLYATRSSVTNCAIGFSSTRRKAICSFASSCRTRSMSSRRSGSSALSPSTTIPRSRAPRPKTRGTRLFVDCARVFALAHGIATRGPLRGCGLPAPRLEVEPRHIDATVEATIPGLLRLRQQDHPTGTIQIASIPTR